VGGNCKERNTQKEGNHGSWSNARNEKAERSKWILSIFLAPSMVPLPNADWPEPVELRPAPLWSVRVGRWGPGGVEKRSTCNCTQLTTPLMTPRSCRPSQSDVDHRSNRDWLRPELTIPPPVKPKTSTQNEDHFIPLFLAARCSFNTRELVISFSSIYLGSHYSCTRP